MLGVAFKWINGFEVIPRSFPVLNWLNISPLAQALIVVGLVLALLNTLVRPIIKLFSFPFIILTFGLFHIVINIAILYLADLLSTTLTITGFKPLFLGSILVGIANALI